MGYGGYGGDQSEYAPDDQMLAQVAPPVNPFPAQMTGQNVSREFQNLADSSTRPRNTQVYDEGRSKPLFNAVTDFAGGAMSSNDLQNLFKAISERGTQSRKALDTRNHTDLQSMDTFAKILGNAHVDDIDGLAEAMLMHKNMQQAAAEYDKSARDQTNNEMMSGLLGKQDSRVARQSYLNSKGIQEFGAPGADGNYNKLDSWQAIAADRAKERDQFKRDMTGNMMAGLMSHLRATGANQEMNSVQQAMGMGAANLAMKKGQEELRLMPQEAQANMDYKHSLANPSPQKTLVSIAEMLKHSPELADQIDLPALLSHATGVPVKAPTQSGGAWDGINKFIFGDKGGKPATKDYGGSQPVPTQSAPQKDEPPEAYIARLKGSMSRDELKKLYDKHYGGKR